MNQAGIEIVCVCVCMCVCVCVCVCAQSLRCVRLFVTLWTASHQASLSMGFSRQEYWSGLPCPPPGDLPYPGIKFASPELAGRFFITEPPARRNISNLKHADNTTLNGRK